MNDFNALKYVLAEFLTSGRAQQPAETVHELIFQIEQRWKVKFTRKALGDIKKMCANKATDQAVTSTLKKRLRNLFESSDWTYARTDARDIISLDANGNIPIV